MLEKVKRPWKSFDEAFYFTRDEILGIKYLTDEN
jgi:hypothetical protein